MAKAFAKLFIINTLYVSGENSIFYRNRYFKDIKNFNQESRV